MIRRLRRQWVWLILGLLLAVALYRYGVTRWQLLDFFPQVWVYAKGLILTLLLVTAASGFGFPFLKALVPVEGRPEALPLAAMLGLGSISLLTLLLGMLGGLYPLMAWAILGVGVLLAAINANQWRYWAHSIDWREVMGESLHLTSFSTLLLFTAAISFAYALTANALTPPLGWDESAYHLALPKLYIDQHRIVNVPTIAYSNLPFNTEMIFTLALLLGSEVMASAVSLAFALLLSVGLLLFAHEEFGWRTALLAVVLFWTIPAVFRLAGSTFIEVPLAAYTFISVWAFWRWHHSTQQEVGWLILAAVMAGFAAGTKLTGAVIAIILVVLTIVYGLWRRQSLVTIATQAGLLGGLACLFVLPWYLKSFLYTGNPVWPFLNGLFGGRYWDALGDEYHNDFLRATNLPLTLSSYLTAPWHLTVRPFQFGSFPLGLLAVVLAPFALVFQPYKRQVVNYLAAIAGLYYTAWFLMTHQTRFLVPIVPVLCLLSGYVLKQLLDRGGRILRLSVQLLVVTLILLELPGVAAHVTGQWASLLPYLVGAESREELLARRSDTIAAYLWANKHLPADAKVLIMPYESRGYFLDRDYVLASPLGQRILKLEEFENVEALWHDLQADGITHLIESSEFMLDNIRYWPKIERLLDELKTEHATPIYVVDRATVYELHQ